MRKVIILVFLLISVIASFAIAKEQENGWEDIGKWLEWKAHTDLPKKQREVVDYFKKSEDIVEKVSNLWYEIPGTIHPKPSPAEGLKLIYEYIAEYKDIKPPKICRKHYEASLAYLDIAREYQEMREKTKDVNELAKVNKKSVKYSDLRYSEFWCVLKEVGLFDNAEEEMKKLGLL